MTWPAAGTVRAQQLQPALRLLFIALSQDRSLNVGDLHREPLDEAQALARYALGRGWLTFSAGLNPDGQQRGPQYNFHGVSRAGVRALAAALLVLVEDGR